MADSKWNRNNEFVRMKLNARFLQKLSLEEKRAFAIVLKIKSIYSNSRVYDYSVAKMSEKFGVSKYITQKYIQIIEDKQWGKVHDGQLELYGLNVITQRFRTKEHYISIEPDDNIGSIIDKINFILLKREVARQNYIKEFKGYELKTKRVCKKKEFTLKDYRKLLKIRKYNPELLRGAYIDFVVIGLRRLSSVFNCSIGNVSYFLKRIELAGLATFEKVKELVRRGVPFATSETIKEVIGNKLGYYFVSNNNLYRYLGTKIVLSIV